MNRPVFAAVAGIVALVVLAYGSSLKNQFVNWDDDAHLLNNPFVHSLNIKDIFTTTVNGIYVPLTSLSFALEYHFVQANPFVYHLNNLLLHLAVTLLVFLFCLRCGLSWQSGAAASAIFGLHPMHVESVAWVTERKDVLYAFFYMSALLFYLNHLRNTEQGIYRKGWPFWLSIICGFLSILAKPMAFSLPLALFACDWFLKRRMTMAAFIEKIYCGMAVLPVVWMSYSLQVKAGAIEIHPVKSVLTSLWSFFFYLKKFFCPDYFVTIYHWPQPVNLSNPVYSSTIAIFIIWLMVIFIFRKNRLFIFANVFYFVSIILLLDHSWTISVVADRFMYLPMLGWCLFLGQSYIDILKRYQHSPKLRIIILLAGAAVLSFLFFQTIRQSRVWYNGASLWEHQLRYQEDAATALIYNKLAQAYIQQPEFKTDSRKMQLAQEYLYKAIAIKPDYAQAYFHLGQLEEYKGNPTLARQYFTKTVTFDSQHFDAYFELGMLEDNEGQYAQAIKAFDNAIESNPGHEGMYRNILSFYDNAIAAGRDVYGPAREKLAEQYIRRFKGNQ